MAYTDTSAIIRNKFKIGQIQLSTTDRTTVDIGFKPIFLCVWKGSNNSDAKTLTMYDERYSTLNCRQVTTGSYSQNRALGTETLDYVNSITENGFTMNKCTNANYQNMVYFAIGENVNSPLRKYAFGSGNTSTSEQTNVVCGFKPKQIMWIHNNADMTMYDERFSTTQVKFGNANTYLQSQNLGVTTNGRLTSIDEDGFTVNKTSGIYPYLWFALG